MRKTALEFWDFQGSKDVRSFLNVYFNKNLN